MTFFV